MLIIIDRKHKRANFDNQWKDTLGVEEAQREKARTLEVDPNSDNLIDKFICKWGARALMGKKVWAIKSDKSRFFEGWVRDIYPSRVLLVKVNGKNRPLTFESIISVEE